MAELTEDQQQAERITLIGAIVDAVLGFSKIIVGMLAHSSALIADGIHSLSDLVTDAFVIVMLRISNQPADKEHPWGHGRFETLGTVILGSILIAVAGAMAFDSVKGLIQIENPALPEWPALVVAGLSILAKEAIYRYTMVIAERLNSELLKANAWHSRTDALSSIVVFIGVAGAMTGLIWLDALAAVLVAVIVAKIGWELMWSSLKQLVDTALPEEDVIKLTQTIMSIEGIVDVHSFKTRRMGSESVLELHIQVASHISASEGHFLGEKAMSELKKAHDHIGHVIFHIDTYDDEATPCELDLPPRSELEHNITDYLSQNHSELALTRLTLHYLNPTLEIEMHLQSKTGEIPNVSKQPIIEFLGDPAWLSDIKVLVSCE